MSEFEIFKKKVHESDEIDSLILEDDDFIDFQVWGNEYRIVVYEKPKDSNGVVKLFKGKKWLGTKHYRDYDESLKNQIHSLYWAAYKKLVGIR